MRSKSNANMSYMNNVAYYACDNNHENYNIVYNMSLTMSMEPRFPLIALLDS